MKAQFEIGKKYGNDLTMEVLKRTEKTLTIKTMFGTQRIKIGTYDNNSESILFKSCLINANELYNVKKSQEISNYNSYYR